MENLELIPNFLSIKRSRLLPQSPFLYTREKNEQTVSDSA